MIEARTTTYEWAGVPNASASLKRTNGEVAQTNFIKNPSAQGTGVSIGGAIASDSALGGNAFKATTTNNGVQTFISQESTAASPGQRWYARARMRMAAAGPGARRMQLNCRFKNSSGASIATGSATQDLLFSGTFRRWSGTAGSSASEEFSGTNRRANYVPSPRGTVLGSAYSGQETLTAGVAVPVPTPAGTTTALRVNVPSGGNNAGVRFTTVSIPAGSYVMLSAWVYVETPNTTLWFGGAIPSVQGTSNFAAVTGQWTRFSGVVLNSTSTGQNVGYRTGVIASAAASYLITDFQAEVVANASVDPATMPFFDGDTTTPFTGTTYAWLGSQNASPSMSRSSDGSTRINYATNPQTPANGPLNTSQAAGYIGWMGRWFGNGSSGTEARVTGDSSAPGLLTSYLRKTWSTVSATQDVGWTHILSGTSGMPVAPGDVVTFSTYVRPSVTPTTLQSQNRLIVTAYDSAGAVAVQSAYAGTSVNLAAGQWSRMSVTVTVPAGVAFLGNAYTQVYLDGMTAGSTLDGTGLLVERSSTLGDYFDGSTVMPTAGKYRFWSGDSDNSASTEVTSAGVIRTNRILNPFFRTGILSWVAPNAAYDSATQRLNGTATVAIANGNSAGATTVPAVAGESRRFGVLFYNTSSTPLPVSLQIQQRSTSGSVLSYLDGTQVTVAPGASAWLTNSTTSSGYVPGTVAAGVAVRIGTAGFPVGSTWQIGQAIDTEYGNGANLVVSDYFDAGQTDSALRMPTFSNGMPDSSVFDMSVASVAPANTASVDIYLTRQGNFSPTVGDVIWADNLVLTQSDSTTTDGYFDGDFPTATTYVNVVRPGQITTDEWLEIDDVPLNTLAYNITTYGGSRLSPPGVRGGNLTIPGRPGVMFMNKELDTLSYTLNMWVQGCAPDGSFPTDHLSQYEFNKNWQMLRRLLFTTRRLMKVTKRWFDADVNAIRSAVGYAQFNGGLEPSMTGRGRAAFSIDLLFPDPFFYEPARELQVSTTQQKTWQETVPGDWRTMSIDVQVAGARVNPKITITHPDGTQTWVQYLGTINAGEVLNIDVQNFSATLTTSTTTRVVSGNIRHAGAAPWLTLDPGANTIFLESTSGSGSVSFTYNPVWF